MEKTTYRTIVINSTVLFVIASVIEMTLHESGHFVAAILAHAKGVTLHHNYAAYSLDSVSLKKSIFIAGTGPAVSLFIGIIFHFLCSNQSSRGMLFLFNLYIAIFGYVGCFGYVMLSPFFP